MDSVEEVLSWHVEEGLVNVEMERVEGIGNKTEGVEAVFFVEEEMSLSFTSSVASWRCFRRRFLWLWRWHCCWFSFGAVGVKKFCCC